MIAFCTPVRNREQHLKRTLPKNLADNKNFPDCKFIVLDYGSEYDLQQYIATYHVEDILSGRLVFYSFPTAARFNMAHAKNMAHRCAMLEGANILCEIDADNFTGEGFAEYLTEKFREPNIFMWTRVRPLDGSDKLPRGCSGRIAVRATDFLKVGGYDEKYDTWGPDDKDFNARLRLLGLDAREIDHRFIDVILHNDKMRFKDYKHVKDCDSGDFEVDPTCPIANFGKFGMGTVYRNFSDKPIELGPLPTRIFGIGMHKTATTSLHHAFEILGYDSAHWKSAHWAKAIWRQMNNLGHSATLEKSYALCDLPIPLLYEQLDRAYPGSKFILTIRREDLWLATVKKHWDPKFNKFRKNWEIDPFTNRIHSVIYGRPDFHGPTFLKRYRRHNEDVVNYFAGRPRDLLIMDMDFGWPKEGPYFLWYELCSFLNKPIPKVPYPNSYSAY
jgi:Sulfotransferase domain/N-terminal domain of galactosyltransferase